MPQESVVTLEELLERARSGDLAAPTEIGSYIETNPQVCAEVGDLAAHAAETLVKIISDGDERAAKCLRKKAQALKRELACDTEFAALRLAADRVVLDWLFLHFLDLLCCQAGADNEGQKNAVLLRKQKAHKLYTGSLKLYSVLRQSLAGPDRRGFKRGQRRNPKQSRRAA